MQGVTTCDSKQFDAALQTEQGARKLIDEAHAKFDNVRDATCVTM